ncbi:MAG: hypothetical protein JKY65_32290, partial [Planctomycetes bacterium]|nr:hypothetical protein [Planctomycetota bacterium]
RPELVIALRGTREPRVGTALVDLYAADEDPRVRAKAAFVLGEGGEQWPPLLVERARVTARLDLESDDPLLITGAGDVLGIPPLSTPDRDLLIRTLRGEANQGARARSTALRALAAAKVVPATLGPALEEVARDSSASPELRAQARSILKSLAGGPK